jgi:hypothetical protein
MKTMPAAGVGPKFFIIGAPRCGTTALCEYLEQHPRIGFSRPKETHFFATDLPGLQDADLPPAGSVKTKEDYIQRCFGHCAGKDYLEIGDGSVWHLYSQEAVHNILRFDPAARFIIMVRNPIDLCRSEYEKSREMLWEDQASFQQAWRLQQERQRGRHVPRFCPDARLLVYGEIAKLGEQVGRAFAAIPAAQRLAVVYDDLARDTASVYAQVLSFLGVPHDGRTEFPRINEARQVRNRRLWQAIVSILTVAVRCKDKLIGSKSLGVYAMLSPFFLVKKSDEAASIPVELRREMQDYFADDIFRLAVLLNRDLSHWA